VHRQDPDSLKSSLESSIISRYGLDTLGIKFEVYFNPDDGYAAYYDMLTNKMMLNYGNVERLSERYGQDLDSLIGAFVKHELVHYDVDKFTEEHGIMFSFNTKRLKELGNTYVNLLSPTKFLFKNENNDLKSFLKDHREDVETILLHSAIYEGIALYYENPDASVMNLDWPVSIDQVQDNFSYFGFVIGIGEKLMFPILERYGWKGAEYVLLNLPKPSEFGKLDEYQRRIMSGLEPAMGSCQ